MSAPREMTTVVALVGLLFTLAPSGLLLSADAVETGEFEWTDRKSGVAFWCYVPGNYDPQSEYGVIVALHGHGSAGVHERNGWRYNMGLEDADFIICCPYLKGFDSKEGSRVDGAVIRLLDHLKRDYRIDATRVLMTGFSMGGRMSAAIYFAHSSSFSALALRAASDPVTAKTIRRTREIRGKPLLVIVGQRDSLGRVARRSIAALRKARFKRVDHIVVPGVGHSSDPGINVPTLKWFRGVVREGKADLSSIQRGKTAQITLSNGSVVTGTVQFARRSSVALLIGGATLKSFRLREVDKIVREGKVVFGGR